MVSLINKNFIANKKPFLFQSLLAGLLTLVILFGLGTVLQMDLLGAIGAGSLASSTCMILIAPSSTMAQNRNLIGGYATGLGMGVLCYYAAMLVQYFFPAYPMNHTAIIFGAIAVGVTQLIMVIIDVEHSPGAGIAIGLVLENWHFSSIMVIAACVFCIALVHHLLRGRIINLI